jgi:glycosyltransferase involved in cell wall biosynthesis
MREKGNSGEVSVVIPTYNGSEFVADALRSVFLQTRLPEEIIVVDDHSPDDTVAIAESLAREVRIPLTVLRLPRNSGGPSRPLNVGIESAKGEVIVILEQDDVMRPQRIASQLKSILKYPQCCLATGGLLVKGNKDGDLSQLWPDSQFSVLEGSVARDAEFWIVESDIAFPALLKRNFGTNSSFCFTKEWCKRIGGFNEHIRTCADLDFILRAVQAGPIFIANETIFEYRWRGDSLHRQSTNESALEATMVRLRASSKTPEWAGEHLRELRYSAMSLAAAKLKSGNLSAVSVVVEVLFRYKGSSVIRQSLWNRMYRRPG